MKDELFRTILARALNVLSFGLLFFIRKYVKKRHPKSKMGKFMDKELDKNHDGKVNLDDMFHEIYHEGSDNDGS